MNENEVKLIRNIIQEVIEEVRNNRPVGATETARIVLCELDRVRIMEKGDKVDNDNVVMSGYQPKCVDKLSNSMPPCGGSSVNCK